MPTVHDTFVIVRSYPAAPARVFDAFADVDKKRRWFGEGSHQDTELFEGEFRVGGFERTRYRMKPGTPIAGMIIATEGVYLDIVDGERIVLAQGMTLGGARISAALVTVELAAEDGGTTLTCTHQAAFFEGADGPQMRRGGWEALFDKLAATLAS